MNVNKHIKNIAVGGMVVFTFNQLVDENNFPVQPIIDLPAHEIPFEQNSGMRFGISSVSAGASDTTFLKFYDPTGSSRT